MTEIIILHCGADGVEPIAPTYKTAGASGADLYASEDAIIPAHGFATISTGLRVAIPQGYELQLRSRSGLACHYGIFSLTGTIDSDYRGEIRAILGNISARDYAVRAGDRIAQLVLAPVARARYERVDKLDETARGAGGYGSTGR